MKLLEQLKDKGIATVHFSFDGEGGSGSIEWIGIWNKENKEVEAGELEKDLKELGYAILDYHHVTFVNDGSFGAISLDVESGAISVEINNRYVTYDTENYRKDIKAYLQEAA